MKNLTWIVATTMVFFSSAANTSAETIRGKVVDASGKPIEGVMVSAIDDEHRKWTSVFTQKNGSFEIKYGQKSDIIKRNMF